MVFLFACLLLSFSFAFSNQFYVSRRMLIQNYRIRKKFLTQFEFLFQKKNAIYQQVGGSNASKLISDFMLGKDEDKVTQTHKLIIYLSCYHKMCCKEPKTRYQLLASKTSKSKLVKHLIRLIKLLDQISYFRLFV